MPTLNSNLTTRGHSHRYAREICISSAQHNFLTNIITNDWNELPEKAVSSI